MTIAMMTPTPSPTSCSAAVAILTAAAAAAAGMAYWSSATSIKACGTLVLNILRATGTIEDQATVVGASINSNSNSSNAKKNKNCCSTTAKNKEGDSTACCSEAFASWVQQEEDEEDHYALYDDLTNPRWMSETIRDALLSTAMATMAAAVTTTTTTSTSTTACSISRGVSSTSSAYSKKGEENMSWLSQVIDDEEGTLCEEDFRRSFRTLQKATETMVHKEPHVREDFFNGVNMMYMDDAENDTSCEDEEKKDERRRRSLSLESSSSGSTTSSSTGFFCDDDNNCSDDYLVDDEEEVERFLQYLHFVELAKEEALSSPSTSSSRKPMIPDVDRYELLHCVTTSIPDVVESSPDRRTVKVGHLAVVHRDRKELVIAVHYDDNDDDDDGACSTSRSSSSTTTYGRNRIKNALTKSLFLQQQQQRTNDSSNSSSNAPSSRPLLLDKAVEHLYEDILLRYLQTTLAEEKEPSSARSSFLSSGYTLIVCGHSLGAALACRLGAALRNRNRDFDISVRVYAFGPPPCLPRRGYRYCANSNNDDGDYDEDYSYITSVVNNHDCIPRWTKSNLIVLRKLLRWTMERKKLYFRRYHNRYHHYNAQEEYTAMTATATATMTTTTSSLPRIPPFSLSSKEWKLFWNNNQEEERTILQREKNKIYRIVSCSSSSSSSRDIEDIEYIVPGKVVCIWNHTQDPTIIGAKIYSPRTTHRHSNSDDNRHRGNKKKKQDDDVLGRLWVDESMFRDHTLEAYRSNLELLLGQAANTI